jgi:hypothetical protein
MLYDPNWAPPATKIELKPWQKIMMKAADILETHGWTRGYYADDTGFCALGAMRIASGMEGEQIIKTFPTGHLMTNHPDYWMATKKLAFHVPGHIVGDWNDDPDQTKQEVIDTLREVAAHAV